MGRNMGFEEMRRRTVRQDRTEDAEMDIRDFTERQEKNEVGNKAEKQE